MTPTSLHILIAGLFAATFFQPGCEGDAKQTEQELEVVIAKLEKTRKKVVELKKQHQPLEQKYQNLREQSLQVHKRLSSARAAYFRALLAQSGYEEKKAALQKLRKQRDRLDAKIENVLEAQDRLLGKVKNQYLETRSVYKRLRALDRRLGRHG